MANGNTARAVTAGGSPIATFDHLAVAAASLDEGITFIEGKLGVQMPSGGKHARMATHNAVMALGPDTYLEVIAIDPAAPAPAHRRWFGLDDRAIADDLARNGPRLHTWIARCTSLSATLAGTCENLGEALAMSRGNLRWSFAVRPDGGLNADGLMPYLIEWEPGQRHPAAAMPDLGVRLLGLTLHSPLPIDLARKLNQIGLTDLPGSLEISSHPRLEAVFDCPLGRVAI